MHSRRLAVIIGIALVVAALAIIVAAASRNMITLVSKEGQNSIDTNGNSIKNASEKEVSQVYKSSATPGTINSPYATEYKLLNGTWPNGIMVDIKGNVWTAGSQSHALIKFEPNTRTVKSYPIPAAATGRGSGMVWTIAENKGDGSIWFSGLGGNNSLWRFEPSKEKFEAVDSLSASPMQIKVDNNGNIWYTTFSRGTIGVIQKDEGSQKYDVKELDLGNESFPSGIFLQNQNLWVTESLEGKIVLFHVGIARNGKSLSNITQVAEFPRQAMLFSPTDIIINNGSAWVTEHNTSFLTEYNANTHKLTRYPTELHPILVTTLPYWLAPDPTGKGLWFNEHRGNRIAYFDFANHTMTEYEVPTRNPVMGHIANVLTIGSDPTNQNRAWFTELTEDKIGYVDRSIPIPFDIHTPTKELILQSGQTAKVNMDILRNPGVKLFNSTLLLKVSSSTVRSGVLLNATASFLPQSIDLSKVNGRQAVKLELDDEGVPQGRYTLAISATDGAVVRTVYLEMVAR